MSAPQNMLIHTEFKPLQLEKPLFMSLSHNSEPPKSNEVIPAGKKQRRKRKPQDDETSVTSKIGSISVNDSESVGTTDSQEPAPKRPSRN